MKVDHDVSPVDLMQKAENMKRVYLVRLPWSGGQNFSWSVLCLPLCMRTHREQRNIFDLPIANCNVSESLDVSWDLREERETLA